MMTKILLIDDDDVARRSTRRTMEELGYDLLEASKETDGLAAARIEHPDAVVVNMDMPGNAALDVCQTLRRLKRTHDIPILGLSSSRSLRQAERFFHRGVSAYLTKPFSTNALVKKIEGLLTGHEAADNGALDVPPELRDLFLALREEAGRLGDMAEIFPGVAPRQNRYRRNGRPGPGWLGVLTSHCVEPFTVQPPETFYKFDRTALLRLPATEEYDQAEKIVLRRTAPPLAAAVDRGRHPVNTDLYAIVPAKGLDCSFIACLLNSRLLDFYFNRIRPIQSTPAGTYLRAVDLEAVPIIVPTKAQQAKFFMYAKALGGLGARPSHEREKRLRGRFMHEMNDAIFAVYGAPDTVVQRLADLHF